MLWTRYEWVKMLTSVPYIWGAIDGSHIRLWNKPTVNQVPTDYFNHHFFHSILLHGVCDMPGCTYDATHLRKSTLWKNLKNKDLMVTFTFEVIGREVTRGISIRRLSRPFETLASKTIQQKANGDKDAKWFWQKVEGWQSQDRECFCYSKNKF